MSHECNTTALGRTVEKGNLYPFVLQRLGIFERSFPGCLLVDSVPIVILDCKLSACLAVNLNLVALCRDNKSWLMGWPKVPMLCQLCTPMYGS